MNIRSYVPADLGEWTRMRTALWPDQTAADMRAWLARDDAVILVAEGQGDALRGFAEAGMRSSADGCRTMPVAYLEGWYVDPACRRQGIGAALIGAVEAWARSHGLTELASDATLENDVSQAAHARLGFEEIGRAVQYRKPL